MIKISTSLVAKTTIFALIALLIGALVIKSQIEASMKQSLAVEKPTLYTLEEGKYAHFVINRFAEKGWLHSPLLIKAKLKLNPKLANIKSGTYELLPGMTVEDFFSMLAFGQVKQFSIGLVEGLVWKDWLKKLNATEHLIPLSEPDLAALPSFEGGSIEGWLLPETYNFTANTKALEIVNRAYVDMRVFLDEQWPLRALDLPYNTPYEALIMASIIEKETGLASERPRISGVFVNRLRQNMRLQTDPTVIYGMGDSFDGDIRKKDLRTPTPYNTYVIKGLPPTPIAMPGKLAILAALHPLETDELYFVARGDGSHKFSKTLSEHNAAVRKYQLKK